MANIYELTGDWLRLWDMADDPDIDEELFFETAMDIEEDIHAKADGYAKVINGIDNSIDFLDNEIKRLQAKKKVLDNRKNNLKKSLQNAMELTGEVKFKTELFSFGIQKNPASLKLADDIDITDIPDEYIKYSDPEIDKAKVKDALKRGCSFDWAKLEQTESLRIR